MPNDSLKDFKNTQNYFAVKMEDCLLHQTGCADVFEIENNFLFLNISFKGILEAVMFCISSHSFIGSCFK